MAGMGLPLGHDRRVALDVVGDATVSTVHLTFDHSMGSGPPVLWETMVFGGEHDQWTDRYTSLEDAVAGHAAAVAMVKGEAA